MLETLHYALRNRLKYSFDEFFSGFGRFSPVQIKAIPLVLDGKNVVVSSPTASGKTEAIVAPLAERCRQNDWQGLSTIYVSPTRALANDIERRLKDPLKGIGISLDIKTGDSPRLPSSPPNWLITTPESLDSLLCRKNSLLSKLKAIVIDEIHILDNTYRGDQLRILLRRIQSLLYPEKPNIYLISATLPDPKSVALRYISDFELVEVSGQRKTQFDILTNEMEVLDFARREECRKILFFCNKRESVEELAQKIKSMQSPYRNHVVVHHGKLNKNERKESESFMKNNDFGICVSTSTLEIGIDIGSIDLVVLAEPPWSVSSLLQRIGRAGRRSGLIRALAVSRSNDEMEIMKSMFEAASKGFLESEEYLPEPSVAVQQIISSCYQNRHGLKKDEITNILDEVYDSSFCDLIINHLIQKREIYFERGLLKLSTRMLDLAEKGEIHSNIPDSINYQVINADTGKKIGDISGDFDEVFLLAGKAWQVVEFRSGVLRVKPFHKKAAAAQFARQRTGGRFSWLLP